MESYRGFYEYPSSQAAIHAVPSKTVGSISPGKAKRNWGNILRIPGWSKKDREATSSSQATIYAPAFNLPQSYHYLSPKYPSQNNHFISSTPYREPGKYYVQDNKEKYGNHNYTYGRSSGSNIAPVQSPRSSKNTVRYTDWFGSVVGRKPPIRPSLPVFHTPPTPLSPENGGVPTVSSWDNYVNMQSPPPHAVEIPALVPVQNYSNICMCPDQIFSTRSKKKKKCKQCGKKYGTVKHGTALGSVAKIRPAIPPSFYKVPVNTPWGWPQGAKVVYAQPAPPALQIHPNPLNLRDDEDDDDSPPPTPETVRTVRSGNSGQSNGSNNTITPESFRSPKYIPPPPTVPLPSIPKATSTPPPSSSKADKRNSLFGSVPTAYDLIDHKKDTSSDELSDNAVDTSWENLNEPISVTNERNSRNSSSRNGQNRVSVISIGGDGPPRNVANDTGITSSKGDSNKVTIFNPSKTVNEIRDGNTSASSVKLNGYHEPNRAKHGVLNEEISPYQNGTPSFLDHSSKSENNSVIYPNKTSSQNKRNKYNVREREIDYNSLLKLDEPDRDATKVVTIAGQRILLDQKQMRRSSKPNNKFKYYENDRRKDADSKDAHKTDISDWDILDELEDMNYKNIESTTNYISPSKSQNGSSSYKSLGQEEDKSKMSNFSAKPVDYKWSKLPSNIKDTIHEEEEEEEESTNGIGQNGQLFRDEEEVKEKEKEVEELEIEGERKREEDGKSQIREVSGNSKEPQGMELQKSNYNPDAFSVNGFHQQEEKEESSSPSESPVRTNGFQPTLSELLQVKSILKRPNSLDTSSETDSDFYLPTFSEFKQNARKKKSVQFQQSDEINLKIGEPKGGAVNALRTSRKERGRRKEKESKVDIIGDLQDIYARNNLQKVKVNPHNKRFSDNYDNNWNATERPTLGHLSEESANNTNNVTQSSVDLSENSKCDEINKQSEGTGNIRRTLSHRQTVDVTVPAFNDTYRLRQTSSRPSVSFPEDSSPLEVRRPTRRAPPPPRNSSTNPLRPTVPPPPPPPPPPPNLTSSESLFKDENTLAEEACDNEVASSLSSTSLSPPPSPPPPPLPSSSPPPLPSSSPPPLDEESDDVVSSPEVPFTSFIDPNSRVSISARSQKIELTSSSGQPLQDISLPPSSSSSSVFKNDFNESPKLATIKGRINATKSLHKSQNSDVPLVRRSDFNETAEDNSNSKRPARSRTPNSSQRMFFLSSMVEETDAEERFSDHIYEEVPSFPSSPTNNLPKFQEKSIFDGASKYEILEFLQDARNRVNIGVDDAEDLNLMNTLSADLQNLEMEDEDDPPGGENQEDALLPSRYTDGRSSNRSSNSESSENSGLLRSDKERLAAGEIERTDSGVGSETSKPLENSKRNARGSGSSIASGGHAGLRDGDLPPCDDCDSPVEARVTNSGVMYAPLVCRRCARRRQERKEILTEIIETEVKYGRDLKVMMDQFCRPMSVAGLLSPAQLDKIFLNVDELIEHNRHFSLQLRDAYEIALDQGDEDLLTVNVAKLFLHASPMLHAFQNYCVRQGAASILLQNLEKEKELLRIFLRVSQMENTLLRRMNLHSFLMVPVQRVTKYPLLLGRLYKTTPPSHSSREDCRRAREKIELYLQHINSETKELSPTKLWRRISMSVGNNGPHKWVTQPPEYDTSMKLRSVALDVLDWGNEDAYVIREGRLLCLPPESTNWTRRGRGLKMATVQMVLVTLGRPKFTLEEKVPEDGLVTPCDLGIKEAAILAFKDHRLTKTALIRDPWLLSKTVITWDAEGEAECFELTDLTTKETFIFKDRECVGTEEWFRSVQFHALSVGSWRRRRPALANIMINGASRS